MDALAQPTIKKRAGHHLRLSQRNLNSQRRMESTLRSRLRLEMPMSLRNMHAFDCTGKIIKYDNAEAVCDAHFDVRMGMYDKRRENLLQKYATDVALATNKSRFVTDILSGDITLLRTQNNVSEGALVDELSRKGYESREAIEGGPGLAGSRATAVLRISA